MAITAAEKTQILKTVVGLFNGGISAANLTALANALDNGESILGLANAMANGSTFTNNIMGGKVTVQSQIDVMMSHFGLTADSEPTSAGFQAENYFRGVIEAGFGFGFIVNEAVNFLSQANLDSQWVPYANLLSNKALVAELYVDKNPPDDYDTMIALLADITSTTLMTQEEAAAYVDSFAANRVVLTSDADNFTGTDGIDIYSGVVDPSGDATTISNADILDGSTGTDQLDIRIASTTNNSNSVALMSTNVENFFLQNQSTTDTFTLDFSNISAEEQVWDKGSVSGASTRASNVDASASVGMQNTLGFFEVHFSGDRSGTSDAFSLSLNGAGSSANSSNFSTITNNGSNDNSFEIVNISSTGTLSNVSLGVDAMTLKTVNVSGDATLILEGHNNFEGLSVVDASQMTAGGLKLNAADSEEASFSFTGSAADDLVRLKNTTINTASSLDGGEGKDTLSSQNFNNLNASAVNSTSGFEVLEGADGGENFNAGSFTTINEFLFTGTTSSNNGFTISDIESSDRIRYSTDITSGGSYALRLEGKNAGTTAVVELSSLNETDGETVLTTSSSNNDRYGIEVRTNIASLTLDSTGTSENPNVIDTAQNNNFFGYAFGNSNTPVFNITGSQNLSIMAKAGVDISDGSKLAGFSTAVNVDASAFTGVLRIAGSVSDDVIKGGSNADIIYSLGGADVLTGNDGADQFRLAEFFNSTDSITDFLIGTDKVGLNEFDFTNTSATQAGAVLATTDYVENRDSITSIGNADANKVIELQGSLSESQIAADAGAAVEAFVLVHNTTSGKAELWYDSDWSTSSSRDKVITFDNVVDLVGLQQFSNADFVEYTF